jgi:uncharacterized membrane protein (UPF0136 family)
MNWWLSDHSSRPLWKRRGPKWLPELHGRWPAIPLAGFRAGIKNNEVKFTGKWFVGFGVFLMACGVAGYLSNPAGAKTALVSGGTFGGLSALWGVLMLRGVAWARLAAGISTIVLVAAFTWRSIAGWMAYAAGEPKLFAAVLITLMLVASLGSLAVLFRARQSHRAA